MNKQVWNESVSALRKVLNELPRDSVEYKFGSCVDNENRHLIWNGTAHNVVATVKFDDSEKKAVLRYRQNSYYAGVLSEFSFKSYKTINVPSPSLRQHSRRARERLERLVARAISARIAARTLPQEVQSEQEAEEVVIGIAAAGTRHEGQQLFNNAIAGLRLSQEEVARLAREYVLEAPSGRSVTLVARQDPAWEPGVHRVRLGEVGETVSTRRGTESSVYQNLDF